MMRTNFRKHLLCTTLLGVAAATPAYGQDQQPEGGIEATQDGQPGDMQQVDDGEILVTGSRIQRRDLTSSSPVAVVQDEEFQLSGATNVEQVLNTLPQVIPGSTGSDNNPGGGVATIQLRGLGTTRNLVLVNGRRYIFYDTNQVVDLNTIPQFLVESVDVVTGGASAVYGSDAMTGVVNFRLRDDLQGVLAGGQVSITNEGDGRRWNTYVALGSELADGRGNIAVFAEYQNREEIFAGDRDFSRRAATEACIAAGSQDEVGIGTIVNFNTPGCATAGTEFGFGPGGSSTLPTARFLYFGGANFNNPNSAGLGNVIFTENGNVRPRTGADLYNYAAVNYLQVPQERWLVGGYGEFEITPAVNAFLEVTFVNNRVANELAATPVTGLFNLDVAQTCGFVSAAVCAQLQQQDANETAANAGDNDPDTPGVQTLPDDPGVVNTFVQRRTIETGPRNQLDERNAFRAMAGVRGPITDSINYELYYSYARTRNSQTQAGNISASAFQAGLDGTGTPINIFGAGTLTPEQVTAITVPTQNSDISELNVASASVAGTVGNFGLGADDIGFAIGAEYRDVAAQFIPDFALGSGDVIGFNAGAPTAGGYDVKEVFGELRIPIVADRPFFHRLEVNGAARYSDYSLGAVGGVTTYAAGVTFAPVPDITFRGQYQRAIRAPNVAELFGGQAVGFPPATDPCAQASAATDATIRALCIATGVPASQVGNAGLQLNEQIEGLFGGNPNLEEETSDSWTAGVVIRPRFIPRLNITIDGYDIEIEDAISTLGGGVNNILNLCYNVIQDASSVYCQAVNRNPGGVISGDQFSVQALQANIGRLTTRGVDLQVDWTLPLEFGMFSEEARFNFFFLGTYVDELNVTPVADLPDQVNECAGRFGTVVCDEPNPEFKWTSRFSLSDGPATVSVRWRHIGSVLDDDDSTTYFVEEIPSMDYIDFSAAFDISDNMTFTMGVNNVFNTFPTVLGDNQEQANTYTNTYDVLGRDFFVAVDLRF